MKILKSHRDGFFEQWNFWSAGKIEFNYVSIDMMQPSDTTWACKNKTEEQQRENDRLLESLRISIPRDGMISPLILVHKNNEYWKPHQGNFWEMIPFIIHTGNNRYRVAKENNYTSISSVAFGVGVSHRVWNYFQKELKKPLDQKINLDIETMVRRGEWL